MYKTLFPDNEYNGIVGISIDGDGYVTTYQTTQQEYNLFTCRTDNSEILLRFYSDFTQNRTEKDILISLKDGLAVSKPVSEEPIPEQVLPRYKAIKNYYITERNAESYRENEGEEIINGWYVPQIENPHIHYQFIGTDSINNLGIFAVVADAGYYITDGEAKVIMDDVGVSDEIDYETGFYILVNEQTEDSSYVAIFNALETTWYVAYENDHMEEDGKCEDGYILEEYNGKKYAVPMSLYDCECIAPFPVCEIGGGLLFVVRANQGYSIIEECKAIKIKNMTTDDIDTPHKVNYITGYWKLP